MINALISSFGPFFVAKKPPPDVGICVQGLGARGKVCGPRHAEGGDDGFFDLMDGKMDGWIYIYIHAVYVYIYIYIYIHMLCMYIHIYICIQMYIYIYM